MKKTGILFACVLLLFTTCGCFAHAQNLLADLNVINSGDTIKIVRNKDTTTIVTNEKFSNIDTTIVIGNDSSLLNGIISKSFILKNNDNGWEVMDGDTSYWFRGFVDAVLDNIFKDGENENNTEYYKNGDKKDCATKRISPKLKRKRVLSSGWMFGYGYLNYSANGLFSVLPSDDPYSLKWSDKWDVIYRFTFFPDNAVSLTTGIGIQSNVFRFDDGFDIYPYTVSTPASGYSKEKCKLVARYVTVPLIADFHITKHINIHAGFVGGLNYRNSHTGFKRNYKIDGQNTEQSTGGSFKEFSTFKADAMAGMELYGITFYVSHSLTGMFKDSYGKELKPFSFGVMLGL